MMTPAHELLLRRWRFIRRGTETLLATIPYRQIPSPYDPARTLPAVLVLSFHVEHELHHRSQLIQYISFLGLPAPSSFI
jgi:uncharacterized damage-inducible protein DinB